MAMMSNRVMAMLMQRAASFILPKAQEPGLKYAPPPPTARFSMKPLPGDGACKIVRNSGLRKRMRAVQRGTLLLPQEEKPHRHASATR